MAAVLIHGCHLKAEAWEKIVFGTEREKGRVPIGIKEAVTRNAELIFWGSGASQTLDGKKESEHIFQVATSSKIKYIAASVDWKSEKLREYLDKVSVIDVTTQNTKDEVMVALKLCEDRGIKELVLVSSPTHIARCLQEALKVQTNVTIYARASETCYASAAPEDVLIIEPPHRGDLPHIPFHQTLRGIFGFLRDEAKAKKFHKELKGLIEEYTKK